MVTVQAVGGGGVARESFEALSHVAHICKAKWYIKSKYKHLYTN